MEGVLGRLLSDPADKIITAFQPLVAGHGFSLSYREPPLRPFGNTVVDFASPTLRVRVTKDREQFLVDLAPAQLAAEWFDLDVVLELLGAPTQLPDGRPFVEGSLDELSRLLLQHLAAIEPLFHKSAFAATKGQLKRLQAQRVERLFGQT
jgi:hypothetical protein